MLIERSDGERGWIGMAPYSVVLRDVIPQNQNDGDDALRRRNTPIAQ
jgi:hypothetical protein